MGGSVCIDDPLGELDHLIGLASVRREIKQVLAEHKALQQQGESRLRLPRPHMLLIGRSGVGKGMVAQSLGEIFRVRGLLRRGHLVCADRSSLVMGYIGQTGRKILAKCKEALDGVLYIDDAHVLADRGFGQEAVDTLLEFMETHGDRIIVVADTWPREIAEFTAAYPRLLAQFKPIEFPLYSADELIGILRVMAKRVEYAVPDDLETTLNPWLEQRMRRAIGRGAFWRSAWEIRELLIGAAKTQATRTGTTTHFDSPQAAWVYVREPVIEFEIASLEVADFQAAMATIGDS
jgi:SpoVK/Ycf46/Vps4 family AAA+-type ATPase